MERVTLSHGSGGIETRELLERILFSKVEEHLKKVKGGYGLDVLDDGATIPLPDGRHMVISVDSYTVNPPFFPGGNIGVLAVSGSINDVLIMGGIPLAILDSIIVEEGFPIKDLELIIESMLETARSENVAVIGGDFKVMPRGQVDGIVIATTGIGIAEKPIIDEPRPGDVILVSDYLGEHGAVILVSQLHHSEFSEASKGYLRSDVKPLTRLMKPLLERYRECITAARDPTRGGLAGVLYEWASRSGLIILVREDSIPIREPVRRYSEMLGVDPLYLASEGVAVLSLKRDCAGEILEYLRSIGFENARLIGEVREGGELGGRVVMETAIGGLRLVDPPHGEIVPRIC